MSAYAWVERLPWLDNFLVSLLGSKRSLLNVSLHVVLFTEKCWLVEKCHLNLTFLRMWLKLLTTLKYMALTNVCSHSSVRDGRRAHVSYTQKWGGFLKVDPLATVLELWEPPQRFLLEKHLPLAAHFSDTEWVKKLAWHIQPVQWTQSHFRGEEQLCSSHQIKWLHSKSN